MGCGTSLYAMHLFGWQLFIAIGAQTASPFVSGHCIRSLRTMIRSIVYIIAVALDDEIISSILDLSFLSRCCSSHDMMNMLRQKCFVTCLIFHAGFQ